MLQSQMVFHEENLLHIQQYVLFNFSIEDVESWFKNKEHFNTTFSDPFMQQPSGIIILTRFWSHFPFVISTAIQEIICS